ncbi:MAG: RdgB/HAM1 family non-canonical purine NTP pyrophosphatase [Acidobacteriaceae bacterium]|nr:RdgB/HAM1 family non-canonical purine NTP pyrophosphatase [Acidobacteriaceae bacterium]
MKSVLYCATTNMDKWKEFRLALQEFYDVQQLPGIRDVAPPDETGTTFEENAALKAEYYSQHCEAPLFADDSGLEVDALGGAPGVYSARYAGPGATDDGNNQLLMQQLRGVDDRTARFVCVIALAQQGKLIQTFRGAVAGRIIDEPRGVLGFGYDPLFFYEPFGCTFGEAPRERKTTVSHRGQALLAMVSWLQSQKSS